MTDEYKSIPVQRAREIAFEFDKTIVIICAWDSVFRKLHTVTYGVSPQDKINAAKGGEICTSALGMDLSKSEPTEDFRTVDAARNAQLRDVALRYLPQIKEMAGQVLDPPNNFFARLVKDLEQSL